MLAGLDAGAVAYCLRQLQHRAVHVQLPLVPLSGMAAAQLCSPLQCRIGTSHSLPLMQARAADGHVCVGIHGGAQRPV